MLLRYIFIFMIVLSGVILPSYAGVPVPFTINLSETVIVTGTPRLQLDVGGVTRYAPYVSGSGTNALSFAYPVVAPDFDRDGVTLVSPLDLNGGTIKDLNGNNATLTFTPPNTSGVRLQSYTVAWTTTPVTPANASSAAFAVTGAPTGATFNYTITSDGGGTPVTGSGTIAGTPHNVTGVNLNPLLSGTLTLSVTVANATGTGNAKTNTVVATIFSGVLDSLPATAAAYSVRRLKASYTGALMRVRRSSDNAEQDIGYAGNGDLDTAALTTFCGVNSCFVKTWYDQSGNARDATQATAGNQPRIVNAGSVETRNSRTFIKFLGSGYYLGTASFTAFSAGMTMSAVAKVDTNGTYNALITKTNVANPAPFDVYNDIYYIGGSGGGLKVMTTGFHASTPLGVWSFEADTSTAKAYLNGSDNGNLTPTPFYNDNGFPIKIGSRNDLFTSLNGVISEGVLFPLRISNTDRQTLENNQKVYYVIP